MLKFFITLMLFICFLVFINIYSARYDDREFKELREELEKDRKE